MDPEAFLDIANQVIKLKMFPYFDIAHSLLCALSVKEDLGAGAQAFSRKHPLACWLSTMLVVFAGGMVANGLLGEPILAPLKNTPQLLVATACWYIVFYTPFDIGYKVAKFLPVKLVASAMKEIYRAKKVCEAGDVIPYDLLIRRHVPSSDPRWCDPCCQVVPQRLHHHDHHRYPEGQRSWIHQVAGAIDPWCVDSNCHGILAAKLVSVR